MAFAWYAVLLVILASSGALAETVVTTCGQSVPRGKAVLEADLDCSAAAVTEAVRMDLGGTLLLQGFTLTAPAAGRALVSDETCRILGPGTIRGSGVSAPGLVKILDVTMMALGSEDGIVSGANKAKLINVTASGYSDGVYARSVTKLVDTHLTGDGIGGFRGAGVAAPYSSEGKATLVRSSITGFGYAGILAERSVRLKDSQVMGNAVDPTCDNGCVDVGSGSLPRLRGTSSCGTSGLWTFVGGIAGPPWGVCSDD